MPATDDQERVLAELEILLLAIRAARDDSQQPDFVRHGADRSTASTQHASQADAITQRAGAATLDGEAFTPARLNESPNPDDRLVASDANIGDQQPWRPPAWRLAAIAALLLVGALLLLWALNRPEGSADGPAAIQRGTQPPAADPAPAPPAGAVQGADSRKVRIALTTIRRVWLRVIVDGRVAVEREVAAGEQLPFGADRSILVRAGDAGAVLVRAGESEQAALGRDGQVLTRAFAATAP